jgi:hypothetical protein
MLLVGDAFCTTKPESFFEAGLVQAPERTVHRVIARRTGGGSSVQKLTRLDVATITPGHGKPISGADLPNALQKLAADFD